MHLCVVILIGWDSDYQNWSTGDTSSSVWTKNTDTCVVSPDLMVDGTDLWNEVSLTCLDWLVYGV
jgi:hypothetical protein